VLERRPQRGSIGKQIAQQWGDRLESFIVFLLGTGLRRGEGLALHCGMLT